MFLAEITTTAERDNAATASRKEIFEMSPNKASSNSASGIRRIPMARENVKSDPTMVSKDKRVTLSRRQIRTADAKRQAKAPKKGLKLYKIPTARPGKATCDKASPTNAILSRTISDPK
jgi:hypothetical protein